MVYIINMTRTQIYLPKSQRDMLAQEARKRNTTISAVVRMIIQEKLETKKPKKTLPKKYSLLETARRISKLGEKGPKDLASNVDKYLYGGI